MDCKDCDLTDYCYSDPVTWGFSLPAHHWQVVSKMRQCIKAIAREIGKEGNLIEVNNPWLN